MGHDILIYTDYKLESMLYRNLLSYIGANYEKINPRESNQKNGIRILQKHTQNKIKNNKIKHWAKTRLYFFRNALIMDIEQSEIIYRALLEVLNEMKNNHRDLLNLLKAYYNCIRFETEPYSHRLAILGDIYRILENDALIARESYVMCECLRKADEILK